MKRCYECSCNPEILNAKACVDRLAHRCLDITMANYYE